MSESTTSPHYYQFPLNLLRYGLSELGDEKLLAQTIVAWTLVEKGKKVWRKDAEHMKTMVDLHLNYNFGNENYLPMDFDPEDSYHQAIFAMNESHLRLHEGRYSHLIRLYRPICEAFAHAAGYTEAYIGTMPDGKGDLSVRMRSDIILDLLYEGQMSLRRFRVLAGLYAAIGSAKYRRISLKHLQYLTGGYKSKAGFENAVGWQTESDDVPPLLTVDQIRYTRNKLLDTRWLAKHYNGRHCFYSNRLSNDELALKVLGDKYYRTDRKLREAKAELKAKQQIAEKQRELERVKAQIKDL